MLYASVGLFRHMYFCALQLKSEGPAADPVYIDKAISLHCKQEL